VREWLKVARIDKCLTLREMGEKLGISESYYCSIENGSRQKRMDISLAFGISAILGIPISKIAEKEQQEREITDGEEEGEE